MDALNAAGYEAYHVTASNYASLEDQMKTDFSQLGLDPDCSYIVTISGEEPGTATPPNSGVGTNIYKPPAYDDFGGDGGSSFLYTYNGTTYTMRYVTITSATAPNLYISSAYDLSNIDNLAETFEEVGSAALAICVDSLTLLPVSSIYSMVYDLTVDSNYVVMDPSALVLHAATAWTRSYIQVWDEARSMWITCQLSTYAVSKARCAGYLYNSATNAPMWNDGVERSLTTYSSQYNNTTQRHQNAVWGYIGNNIVYDLAGDISFYYVDNENVVINGNHTPLFTHYEWLGYVQLPSE